MNAGQVFIIFGELKSTWAANFVVSELDGKNGFIANGVSEGDRAGTSIGGGVDLSGDKVPDLLIGAPKAMGTGVVYVIYGGPSHWNPSIELSSVNGSIPGLVISGSVGSATGYSVAATKGVNGVKNDLLVGAPTALQLSQICQLNDVYLGTMTQILQWSYVVIILPSTLILVMLALETLEWAQSVNS